MGDVFGQNFVQDNATPDTACDMATFLAQKDTEVMDWTNWSPDINPMKYVWD